MNNTAPNRLNRMVLRLQNTVKKLRQSVKQSSINANSARRSKFVLQPLKQMVADIEKKAKEKGTALISIKPVSLGRWPKDMEKTYKWWYRPIDDPEQMKSAMRWVFSLPGMVTGIPASFLPVLDDMMDGVQGLGPAKEADPVELQKFSID